MIPSIKRLGVLLHPPDGILVHHRVPSIKWLGVLLHPPDGILVHHRVPSIKWLGVSLLPPARNAISSQSKPKQFVTVG